MRTAPAFDAPVADWLVFADWLQTQGDPRGELIGLVHAGDDAKREAFVRANAPALLGEAAAQYGTALSVRWRWCFVEEAEVRGVSAADIAATLDALLAGPSASRLSSLRLVGVPDGATPLDLGGVVARLTTQGPSTLSSLTLIDQRAASSTTLTSRDFDPDNNLVDFGPLAPLWAMKNLRKLKLVVADTLQLVPGTIASEQLTSLTIHGLRFAHGSYGDAADPSELARALAVAKLPRLEEFDLRLCEEWVVNELDDTGSYTSHDGGGEGDGDNIGDNEGADWDGEFGDALRTLVKSPLKRLALTSFDSTSELLRADQVDRLAGDAEGLDLSDSSLSHADVEWFTANAALLASLEKLVVKDTSFIPADVALLARLVPKVEHSSRDEDEHQSTPDDDEGAAEPLPLPKYRYIVGME